MKNKMTKEWTDQEKFDRICNLVINDCDYTYRARHELVGLLIKMGEKFKIA